MLPQKWTLIMRKHISTIFISLAVFLIVAAIIIYSTFSWGGTPKPEDFGYFGSFIGGVAGPIITALSVFFVIQQLKGDEKKNQIAPSLIEGAGDKIGKKLLAYRI